MKRTHIAAILIAISSSNASAQQTISVPHQAGQAWGAPSYQVYQPQVQYQSYPVVQGQYFAIPQPAVPATTHQALPVSGPSTSVWQSSDTQPKPKQVDSPGKAPAPAPSIPPQTEDLIAAAPASPLRTRAVAPAPSIPTQPKGMLAPAAPASVALAESVSPKVKSVFAPQQSQEGLVVSKGVEAVVEPAQEAITPVETVVAESRPEVAPVQEGLPGGLSGELLASTSDANPGLIPEMSVVEPVEELVGEVAPVIDVVEPIEIAMAEVEVAEPGALSSALESEPVDATAVVAAPVQEASGQLASAGVASVEVAATEVQGVTKTAADTAQVSLRRNGSYGGWLMAMLSLLAASVLAYWGVRKLKQGAKVNSFANDALAQINSKPATSSTASEPATRKLAQVAKLSQSGKAVERTVEPSSVVKEATASASTGQSAKPAEIDAVAKGGLGDAGVVKAETASVPERKEATTKVDDFSSHDQFCCIRGIDAGTQEALHSAGYVRFSELATATRSELELALSKNDRQFSSSDFSRWSSLAALAGQGDWAGFETLQASFAVPKASEARTEEPTAACVVTGDDLTKVRGIGPATAELLNNAGVNTFNDLAQANPAGLQEILDAGGAKFDAIDPSLWCRQAQFQLTGTWARPVAEPVVVATEADKETVQPNVTITTPEYQIAELSEGLSSESEQTLEPEVSDASGILSKEEVDLLKRLAGTPGQLNEESALLDQVNAIREVASGAAENSVSEAVFPAVDVSKTSAK